MERNFICCVAQAFKTLSEFSHFEYDLNSSDFILPINRPEFISPLDDLTFDMYQDPEVAQIIRKLENKKLEAVRRKSQINEL